MYSRMSKQPTDKPKYMHETHFWQLSSAKDLTSISKLMNAINYISVLNAALHHICCCNLQLEMTVTAK